MGLFKKFVNQTRKPEGFLGKMMIKLMNKGHAKMADWGLSKLSAGNPLKIADFGCGGGRNAGELLRRYGEAFVLALDYSPLSVEQALAYNRAMIDAGRCEVRQGDVSALTLPEESFDLATAFETIYFWPGLSSCFKEVRRVLKPDGTFLIVNELSEAGKTSEKYENLIQGMKVYTAEEIAAALKEAGFSSVKMSRHGKKPWIAVIGIK